MNDDDPRSMMQSIFNSTRCYDIMPESNKVLVFEANIYFQLAFFALIEHETEVAPLWDTEKRCVVGMMTIYDYIRTVHICGARGYPVVDIINKPVAEVFSILSLSQHEIQTIDAEDSVYQLYMLLTRSGLEYVSVMNPDEGHLVSVLGYFDIINMLHVALKQQPQIFGYSVEAVLLNQAAAVSAPSSSKVIDILNAIETGGLHSIPIIDEVSSTVVGIYHKSDVGFIVASTDPESIINNLNSMTVGDALYTQNLSSSPSRELVGTDLPPSPRQYTLVKCFARDQLSSVIELMINHRVVSLVCVNEWDMCVGVVTIKEILNYYFNPVRR